MRKNNNYHKNGWHHIEKWLKRKKKNQSDLARKLNMSPAAVTQIKNGDFTLHPAMFDFIFAWLNPSKEEKEAFFSEVVSARLWRELKVTLK